MSTPGPRRIRVTPSAPAPNYAPAYLAEDLGMFAREGLEVVSDVYAGAGSSWLADNLLQGKAEVALGGIWIPLAYARKIAVLPAFAMVCARNPQVLMARRPYQTFSWDDAYGQRVLLSMSSTSQWLWLEAGIRERGQDPAQIRFVRDLEETTMLRLWRAGLGDFFLVTPPLSEELEDEGYFPVTSLAESFGAVPWSVYYTTAAQLGPGGERLRPFARALQHSLDWIHGHDSDDVASVLHPRFRQVPHERLRRAVAGLRRREVWPVSVSIAPEPYIRYEQMIMRYGLIDEMLPFDDMVMSTETWPRYS